MDMLINSLHSNVLKDAKTLLLDNHYEQALFDVFKKIDSRVQKISDLEELGTSLMSKAFSDKSKLNPCISKQKGEKEGIKFIFMGTFLSIRNVLAHTSDYSKVSKEETIELLFLASLLHRKIDLSEQRLKASISKTIKSISSLPLKKSNSIEINLYNDYSLKDTMSRLSESLLESIKPMNYSGILIDEQFLKSVDNIRYNFADNFASNFPPIDYAKMFPTNDFNKDFIENLNKLR